MTTAARPGPAPSDKKPKNFNVSERRAIAVAEMSRQQGMSLSAFVDSLLQMVIDGKIPASSVLPTPTLPPIADKPKRGSSGE